MLTAGLRVISKPMAAGDSRALPRWMVDRFRSKDPLARFLRQSRNLGVSMLGGFVVLACAMFAWVISTNGGPLVAGVPAPGVIILALGLAGWLVRVCAQVPSIAECVAARERGVTVFAVGLFPATRTYLVVRDKALTLVFGTGREAVIDWQVIDVAGLRVTQFGVGVSLSIDGEWYDIPVVLEVGGAVAPAWSWAPLGAKRSLVTALDRSLKQHVPVHLSQAGSGADSPH